jgi:hypothetical protein
VNVNKSPVLFPVKSVAVHVNTSVFQESQNHQKLHCAQNVKLLLNLLITADSQLWSVKELKLQFATNVANRLMKMKSMKKVVLLLNVAVQIMNVVIKSTQGKSKFLVKVQNVQV